MPPHVFPQSNNPKIAIIGLGYVGLPLAIEFAKQYDVIGFDIDSNRVKSLQNLTDETGEFTATELDVLKSVTLTHDEADLDASSIFIITVPTPVRQDYYPDLTFLVSASQTVGRHISDGGLVIYESTVYPGCTEEECVPVIEEVSGLTLNEGFYCGYSPERINPGANSISIKDIVKITSGSNEYAATVVDELYSSIIDAGTHRVSSMAIAEAAKVFENTQRDVNIALVNEFSVMLERMGIDTKEILDAVETKWNALKFRPGLVGGHCIGIDPYFLAHKARTLGYHPQVILAGRRINNDMPRYLVRNVLKRLGPVTDPKGSRRFLILGLAFKENCADVRNTRVVDIIAELDQWGFEADVFDPVVDSEAAKETLGHALLDEIPNGKYAGIICAVCHDEFKRLQADQFRSFCVGDAPVFADIKSMYDRSELEGEGFTIFRM